MDRRQFPTRSVTLLSATSLGLKLPEASTWSGFRMPEEADPHERTFLQWPVN